MDVKVMNMKISRAKIALSLVIGLVAGLVGTTAPANALGTAKTQASVSWTWQDSADRAHRDFAEEDYDMITDLPMVRVLVTPPSVSRRVILDEFDELSGEWSMSYSGRTDALGIALLPVNPLCLGDFGTSPTWCDHDVTYRIRVLRSGTQKNMTSRSFTVSYLAAGEGTF
jgi:hypothetical protein